MGQRGSLGLPVDLERDRESEADRVGQSELETDDGQRVRYFPGSLLYFFTIFLFSLGE